MSTQSPIRTCIGCRKRATAAELLRVVVAPEPVGETVVHGSCAVAGPAASQIVPDPRRRIQGRGAWLHPVRGCVELAQRRRAFSRALRTSGELDSSPVLEYVAAATPTASGTPQEMKS